MSVNSLLRSRSIRPQRMAVAIALLGLIAISPLSTANAGALQIWPIEVSLEGAGDVVQVNIKNTSGVDTFVQATAVEWPSSDGLINQERTDDVLVSPPVFDLPADELQTIRLALRKPLDMKTERTYRLVVTEIAKTAGLLPNTLNVAVSMNMPVFVTPKEAAAKPSWTLVNTDFEGQHLVMKNQGNAHVNIKQIALSAADDQEPFFQSEKGGYVLAGEEKHWSVEDVLAELKGSIAVRVETAQGPIQTMIELPDS